MHDVIADAHADDWVLPKERRGLVVESNHEISKIAEGMKRLLGESRDEDYLMYHAMLARIMQLSELQFFALRLHGNSGADAVRQHGMSDSLEYLHRVYAGGM